MAVYEVTRVNLVGVEEMCWRCHRSTVALIGVRPQNGRHAGSLVSCQDENVLASAAAALPAEAAARTGVGLVKPRFSRTRNGEYLSNGCVHCDALLGDFYLYHETLPEVLALEGFGGLVTIATVDVRAPI